MSKRKQVVETQLVQKNTMDIDDENSSGEEDFDEIDVDFEWFDPQPEVDFHGIKTLLQQLFDIDAQLFDVSALTDLILDQPAVGSTVKVDGQETDAYAFLSVLNLNQHKDKPFVATLTQYLRIKAGQQPKLAPLAELLSKLDKAQIGLVLTERLINVPAQVVPPMYKMLREEIQWALEEKEPYQFTHYLIFSKTYTEVDSKLDAEDDRPKKKKKATGTTFETMFFHPEDEILQKHALCYGGFDYTSKHDDGMSDSKRAFQELGIKPQSHVILIDADKFEDAVNDIEAYLQAPA